MCNHRSTASTLAVTHFTDPACPWAYSASPDLTLLAWRYGRQLVWRHVLIGLAENREADVTRGFTATGNGLVRREALEGGALWKLA